MDKSEVLILTEPSDLHAIVVAGVLRQKGHEAVLLCTADFPTQQWRTVFVSQDDVSWNISDSEFTLDDQRFDTVWFRRVSNDPVLPEDLHIGDHQIAQRSCRAFTQSLWQIISPEAFWVNDLASRGRATSKPIQLLEASRSGLKIPPTLFSNDPKKIQNFVSRHEGRVVFKSHRPAAWKFDGGIALSYTSELALSDLPDDEILELSSGIFQERIEKEYEIRATYIGNLGIAAKLITQIHSTTRLDWRESYKDIVVEQLKSLPPPVDLACRNLMKRLGIVFGCFDLIMTPQGEYVFLEVNEMGQFLWIEEANPQIMLLDPFCEFLVQREVDFDWKRGESALRLDAFMEDALSRMDEARLKHVNRRPPHLVSDHDSRIGMAACPNPKMVQGWQS